MAFKVYRHIIFSLFLLILVISGCFEEQASKEKTSTPVNNDSIKENNPGNTVSLENTTAFDTLCEFEKSLIRAGLVNVKELDTSFVVDLRYSTTNNFMGKDVYGDWVNAYLQKEVAEKLVLAQHFLRSKYPNYSIIIFDAARPVSVQQKMWDTLNIPLAEKIQYLSNPKNRSLHNYGAAVDVSIVNEYREEMDMGTPFDYFGELAYPSKEKEMLEAGKLTQKQIDHRRLLREVMGKSDFTSLSTEWWHFNSCSREEAKARYNLIK